MVKLLPVIISALSGEEHAMNSDIPLSMHKVCGCSMLHHAIRTAGKLTNTTPFILLDENVQQIREHILSIGQEAKVLDMSTGDCDELHALVHLADDDSMIIVIPVNMPLITTTALQNMIQYTKDNALDLTVMSSSSDCLNNISFQNQVCCFSIKRLNAVLFKQKNLTTDILKENKDFCYKIFKPSDPNELLMVNNRVDLAEAEARMQLRINEFHMKNGVTLIDPNQSYIGSEARIGCDTLLYPGNVIEGNTTIGRNCILYPNNRLHNANIEDGVTLQSSVVLDSSIGENSTVGPFAYIRPNSTIGRHVRIGDFVEVKKSVIGSRTKVSHLTYIGDAQLGEDVNVGCGVVCVNYDGKKKQMVKVGDHAFIGCNVNLVAPVEVEHNAYIAAGSTITEKVPAKSLAIARARQINKDAWVDKRDQKE